MRHTEKTWNLDIFGSPTRGLARHIFGQVGAKFFFNMEAHAELPGYSSNMIPFHECSKMIKKRISDAIPGIYNIIYIIYIYIYSYIHINII